MPSPTQFDNLKRLRDDTYFAAGNCSLDDLKSLLDEGKIKSWVLVSDPNTEKDHVVFNGGREEIDKRGITFLNTPVTLGSLTWEKASELLQGMANLEAPMMVQCRSAARASAVLGMHLAVKEKWGMAESGTCRQLFRQWAEADQLSCAGQPKLLAWAVMSADRSLLAEKPPIIFQQLFDDESSTYTYLLADAETKEAVLIDPVDTQVDRDIQALKDAGVTLKYALNTHVHADHITGSGLLKKKLEGVKSVISAASGAKADMFLKEDESLKFGHFALWGRRTPGHTNGCMSYVVSDGKTWRVFTGDALLIGGCGRTDFQQGSSSTLYDSVHTKLFTLPGQTCVYPAHDYKGNKCSSIEKERTENPRLTKTKEEFAEIMANLGLPYPKKIDASLPANLVCGIQDNMQ